jgi:hypothetical protein
MPELAHEIGTALGTADGWELLLDPDDKDQQTVLFVYPRSARTTAQGRHWLYQTISSSNLARAATPSYHASYHPLSGREFSRRATGFRDGSADVSRRAHLWEKVTILHALHHNGKLRDGLSRHYYDVLMLDGASITAGAVSQPDLLAQVVHNKSLMFADKSASYETAVLGTLKLLPQDEMMEQLAQDYDAMQDMFMASPPAFSALIDGIALIERAINAANEKQI